MQRLLGQGGMSNIYLCEDRHLRGRRWVVKEMIARYSDPQEQQMAVQLFEREAHLLASLDHRNLPKVNDYFIYQGRYYLVMEHVEGEDLGRILARAKGPLPERQVAELGEQMATVLYYLHRHKPHPIIFRDVKPSNIMICGNLIKLIDFGIARHFNPAKKGDTMRIGSPGYAPPEQYSGQTDPRSDIYALGVTLHQAITGRDPTTTQTPFILPPVKGLNPSASDELIRIIETATQLDPDKRYQNMLDMKRDLLGLVRNLSGGTRVVRGPDSTGLMAVSPAAPSAQPVAVATNPPALTPPAAAATPSAPKPPKVRKGSPLKWFFLLLLLAGVGLVARYFPHVVDDGREWIRTFWSRIVPPAPAREPAAQGAQMLREGYPLPAILQFLATARQKAPQDPNLMIQQNNALALATNPNSLRVGVLLPARDSTETLRGLATAQGVVNGLGGLGGRPLLLLAAPYSDPAQALRLASDLQLGKLSRRPAAQRKGYGPPVEALLAFGPSLPALKAGIPVLHMESQLPPDRTLPLQQLAELAGGNNLVPSEGSWVEPMKSSGLKVVEAPGGPRDILVARASAGPVGEGGQTVILLAEGEEQLPAVQGNKSNRALVRFSALTSGSWAAAFVRAYRSSFGSAPTVPAARAYDALLWLGTEHFSSNEPYRGVGVERDAPPSPWALFEWTGKGWSLQEVGQ
ncbi:MAG: bifunctional serine/threonine-protein kinase/ABC transporter substrate-binding protein [Candidatus Eremiobacterota bacterium]